MSHYKLLLATIFGTLLAGSQLGWGQDIRNAIQTGNIEAVERAIKADPDILKAQDDSTIILALRNGRQNIAKKLIEMGADVNAKDGQKNSALHWSIMRRDDEQMKLLVEKGAKLNAKNNQGYTPLFMALMYNNPRAAKQLINAGCDVNSVGQNRMTPLHYAFNTGNTELAELLIDKGLDVFAVNKQGVTPYMQACQTGQVEFAKKYFDERKSLLKTQAGDNCLLYATYSRKPELVEFFCERTDFENTVGGNAQTPLAYAAASNALDVVKVLLKHGADPNIKLSQNYLQYPLASAVQFGNLEMTQALLDAGAKTDMVQAQTGNQPLHVASLTTSQVYGQLNPEQMQRGAKVIQLLLDAKADPNAKNQAGQTPLQLAVQSNYPNAIDLLIKRTREINIDMGTQTFLHWACKNEMPNTVSVLLERDKSKVNVSNDEGETPLCLASLYGNVKIMKSLIAAGADVNLVGEDGLAPIHAAVAAKPQKSAPVPGRGFGGRVAQEQLEPETNKPILKPIETVLVLVDAGCDLTLADGSGRMPLHTAAWHGNTGAVKLFASKSVNMTPLTQAGSTPLHLAAWQNHMETAEALFVLKAPIDKKDSDGWTPLHKAAHRGNLEMVRLLLKRGANKTITDSLGLSAFDKAGGEQKEAIEKALRFKSSNLP